MQTMTRSPLMHYGLGLIAISASLLFLWPGLVRNLFSTGFGDSEFMSHGHCYLWVRSLVALHVSSDAVIGISYVFIAAKLVHLVHLGRRDIPFHWLFLAFGLFIVACGATHFMEIWTLWNPTYWLSGYAKLVTAVASLTTAAVLPAVVPKALVLVRQAKAGEGHRHALVSVNEELKKELAKREAAEEALRQSSQTLQAVFQASPLAICVVDAEGKVSMWNPAAERVFGWSREEVIGGPVPYIPEAERVDFRTVVLRGLQPTEYEGRRSRKDGTPVDVSVSLAPLWDIAGVHAGVVGIITDVTERKRTAEALRASEARLAGILDIAPDAVVSVDAGERITLFNQAAEETFGFAAAEVMGRPLDILLPPAVAERLHQYMRDFGASGDVSRRMAERTEVHGRRRDGSLFPAEISISKLDLDGALVLTAIVRDVTDRKQAEAERDAERRLLAALVDQIPVGVLFSDSNGRFTRVNQSACDILGLEFSALLGMSVSEVAKRLNARRPDGTAVPSGETPPLRALQVQGPLDAEKYMIDTPQGQRRLLDVTAAAIAADSGAPQGVVTVVNDVTVEQGLQEQLRQAQKMESVGTLAGGIAHDFNNILSVILGNIQLALRATSSDSRLSGRLVEIERATNRGAALTRQLLTFSRRQRLERKVVSLNDIVNDTMKMLRRIIGEDVEVHVQEAMSLWPVFADPAQVEQVVMNLALNARDAMPQGGRLTIETRNFTLEAADAMPHQNVAPGRYAQIVVSDTGSGITEEAKARIYEPFFTTKDVGKGTGLGLAMVFGIVQQHGGIIEVESDVGVGTTFKIWLPVSEEAATRDAEVATPLVRGGQETILLVEDEDALRIMAQDVLEDLGYAVLVASNGVEAVEIFQAHAGEISLVVLDIVMPRMSGPEAYRRIRALAPDVPALFMTGYSRDIVVGDFGDEGGLLGETAAPILQKPYSLEMLGRTVREILDARGGRHSTTKAQG